jgi:hypothetical protein
MERNQSSFDDPFLNPVLAEKHLRGYLAARCVSAETAKAARLSSLSKHQIEHLLELGSVPRAGGLGIPYLGYGEESWRVRLDDAPDKGGRWRTMKGQPVRPYFPPAPVIAKEFWEDCSQTLFIPEGPIKALAMSQIGCPSIGLGGVETGHDVEVWREKREAKLHPEILARMKLELRPVVITFDAGRVLNARVAYGEARIAAAFTNAGAVVSLAELPLYEDKDQGPDDFLAREGASALRSVLDDAMPASAKEQLRLVLHNGKEAILELLNSNTFLAALAVGGADLIREVVENTREFINPRVLWSRVKQFFASLGGEPLPEFLAKDLKPQIIVTNRQLGELAAESWDAVKQANQPPSLFLRASRPARLRFREEGAPLLEEVGVIEMKGILARSADWFKTKATPKGYKLSAISPPHDLASDCVVNPDASLPQIEAVIECPIFAYDGSLTEVAGYHQRAKVWYTGALTLPVIPNNPTPEQIKAAKDFLLHFLVDFPFASNADRAHAIGALLLPLVRRKIKGPTPLHSVDSPVQGSGKGLFVHVVATVYTGKEAQAQRLSTEEEEVAKALLAELSSARSIILLDNVDTKGRRIINSGVLEGVLTSEEWSGRELGKTKMVTYPNNATWFVTGVNLEFTKGLMRRRIRIRLDPRCETPWTRQDFVHPDILSWTRQHRTKIVAALCTLVRAYLALPDADKPIVARHGSFEAWSQIIGGILAVAGIEGFLGHLDDPEEELVEVGSEEWPEFVELWWKEYHGSDMPQATIPTTVGKLTDLATLNDLLERVRGEGGKRSQETRMGTGLRRLRGRVFGGKRIGYVPDKKAKQATYQLSMLSAEVTPEPQEPEVYDDNPAEDFGF